MKFPLNLPRTIINNNKKIAFLRLFQVFLIFFVLSSCAREKSGNVDVVDVIDETVYVDPLRIRAEEIVNSMDDRLLAAQLLISGVDGNSALPLNMVELFTEIPAGGIMLFKYNLNTNTDTIRSFLKEISAFINEKAGIPPFMAVDHEGGTVNRLPSGAADLPSAVVYWELFVKEGKEAALKKIEEDTLRTGKQLSELGINMNFAPVAETLIDENRAFLSRRSYGPDHAFTAEAVSIFVESMRQSGVLCVVKHFPGSAGTDPHYSKSVLNMDKASLDILVSPFTAAIKNGAKAIMAAHTAVPAIDSEIATLSPVIMGKWLRGELMFDGIIISDDFIMAAAGNQNPEDAAVLSVIAGSDMILVWPAHLRKTHEAFMKALEEGRLSRERLLDAALRVIYKKLEMGLF